MIENSEWKSSIVSAIINNNNGDSIFNIIENYGRSIVTDYKSKDRHNFVIPLTKIVEDKGIIIKNISSEYQHGKIELIGSNYLIHTKKNNTSVHRYRFTLAHELSHLLVRRLAGPISKDQNNKQSMQEEEFVVNLLAGAILIPNNIIKDNININEVITSQIIDDLARRCMVSRIVVLKRIGVVFNKLILLWDLIPNPLNKKSETALRINSIFPLLYNITHQYLPLYCKAKDHRFDPNIIMNSFRNRISSMERVLVSDFGTLPEKPYLMHNVYFRKWSPKLLFNNIVESRKDFYSIATFIDYKYAYK